MTNWHEWNDCMTCGAKAGRPCKNTTALINFHKLLDHPHFTRKKIEREKYLVTLEIEIPAAGTAIGDHSLQNSPDKWNWERMIDCDKGSPYQYNIKMINNMKIK